MVMFVILEMMYFGDGHQTSNHCTCPCILYKIDHFYLLFILKGMHVMMMMIMMASETSVIIVVL